MNIHELVVKYNSSTILPWIVFAGSILVTIFVWDINYEKKLEQAYERFTSEAIETVATIEHRMDSYEQIIRSGVSFIESTREVTSEAWHTFFTNMQLQTKFPGIQTLGLAVVIHPDVLKDNILAISKESLRYAVHPIKKHNNSAIIYLEPQTAQSKTVLGFDMSQNSVLNDAMLIARDTGKVTLSGKVSLEDFTGITGIQQPGVVMYMPIYQQRATLQTVVERRAAIIGFVFAALHIDNVMQEIIASKQSVVNYHLFDGDSATDLSALLYDSDNVFFYDKEPSYKQIRHVIIAGRDWTFAFTSSPKFEASVNFDKANILAISGFLFSIFLFVFAYGITHARKLAVKKAAQAAENLRESETRASAILNTAVNAIITMGSDRCIRTFNPAAAKMFGYSTESVLGKNVNILMPEPFHSEHDSYIAHHLHTGECKVIGYGREVIGLRSNGTTFPLWLAVNSARLNNELIFVGCVVDISEHKKTENMLIQAKEAAEMANRAKSAFLANMSHELRTPLNAMLGYAQILQQDKNLNELQLRGVNTIKRSGDHLLTLINDVLDLAKVEAGHLDIYPNIFDIKSFFSEMNDMFRIRAMEKGLNFHYQAGSNLPDMINTDEKRLRQICMNLLGNAIKFTEHGEVRLEANYKDSTLSINVIDSGIGISDTMCEQIFKPFVQTGTDKYKQQGTGLGLAISYNLVKRMGGNIEVKSVINTGSSFKVNLPVPAICALPSSIVSKKEAELNITGYQRTDAITQPLHILVVDDVTENRDVLRGLLEPLGFIITDAADGVIAVNITEKQNFDLIFMDLVMPNMDGLTATKKILQRSNNAKQIIIALTASAFEEDRGISLSIGCRDYLIKPVEFSNLLKMLSIHLPLKWNYSQPAATTELHQLTEDTPLSSAQRTAILNMIRRGAIYEITRYLDDLLATSDCPGQVRILLPLAKNFKLNEMRRLLETA